MLTYNATRVGNKSLDQYLFGRQDVLSDIVKEDLFWSFFWLSGFEW